MWRPAPRGRIAARTHLALRGGNGLETIGTCPVSPTSGMWRSGSAGKV